MKSAIYKFASALLMVSLMSSCTDFLTEKPKSELNTGQYFAQPDHARSAVNTLYRTGVPTYYHASSAYAGPYYMYGGYISGLIDNQYKGQEVIAQYSQTLTHTASNIASSLDDVWFYAYRAISRANTAIKYIPTTPGLDDTEKKSLLAQAKFFRAYNYFYLVKFFGDVPLVLEPYESLEDLYAARTPSVDVYAAITTDLQDAVDGLNNASFTNNDFRVTKASAEMLLASAYLQMSGYPVKANKYAEAAAARSIITSGKHALLQNGATPEESAYNKIRTLDDSNEYIYSYEYESGIADNGWRAVYSFPSTVAGLGIFKYAITALTYWPMPELIAAYGSNDLRGQEKQYFFKHYTYTKDGETKTIELSDVSPWFFYNEKAMLETGVGDKDIAIYRYAEVLLVAAEAIAESEGVNGEAAGYLAQVRARAYQTTVESVKQQLLGLSKEEFIQEVWKERLRELMPEGRMWDDIQRTRMYPKTNNGEITFVNVVGATNRWGATYQEKHLLWPISANELQRNPNLVQNPGFEEKF